MGIVHCDGAKVSDVTPKILTEHQLFFNRINQKNIAYNPGMGIVHCDGAKVSDVTPKILTEHQIVCPSKHKSENSSL